MRKIDRIIVHCTATRADWWKSKSSTAKVNEIRRWHMDKGWSDIGYHFLIDRDGTLKTGRPIEKVGAHVRGHNTGTIGVSLFGGHGGSETDSFDDNFTKEQEVTLRFIIEDILSNHGEHITIHGHNEYAAKACPCFDAPKWWHAVSFIAPKPVRIGFWKRIFG